MAGYTKNADGTYSVNYEDERFKNVENEKTQQINNTNQVYDNMINNSNKYYQDQINAAQDYANKQSELQQAKTDFALEQINQQKDQTEKDYIKEQKASYVDYQKESNKYGVNAEQLASSGLTNTGYSESSKVSMYNTYQNRVASARDTYNQAVINFNNQMQQATLSNNDILAEIAYNALQTQLKLSQESFEYNNSLVLAKEDALQELNDRYYQRYQDVLAQANNEINVQMQIDEINREYEKWVKEMQMKIEYNNAQIANLKVEAEYKKAQIENINADTSYKRAQTSALAYSSNPYSDNSTAKTNDTKLSAKGQTVYNGTIDLANKAKSFSTQGKNNAKDTIAKGLSRTLKAGIITDSQMQKIINEAYDIIDFGSTSGGGGAF